MNAKPPSLKTFSSDTQPAYRWAVFYPESGKRKRKLFRTKAAAEDFLNLKHVEFRNLGAEISNALTDALRREAVECQRNLSEYGKTLTDATAFLIEHLKETEKSERIAVLAERFQKSKETEQKSAPYLKELRNRLRPFVEYHGDRYASEISTREAQEYLDGLAVGPVSKNHARRVLSAFFAYCERMGYASGNPVLKTSKVKATGGEIETFTPGEIRALLNAARELEHTDVIVSVAVGAFSGLRESEIDRLTWDAFKWKQSKIDLAKGKTKSARRRLVTIPENLAGWLEPYSFKTGRVRGKFYRNRFEAVRAKSGVSWKNNGLRHGFASHHLALHQDAGKTAHELGHTDAGIVYSHYRALVSEDDAAEWFQIRPGKGTVISMAG